jgi:hypothetical protein
LDYVEGTHTQLSSCLPSIIAEYGDAESLCGAVHSRFDAIESLCGAVHSRFDAAESLCGAVHSRFDAVESLRCSRELCAAHSRFGLTRVRVLSLQIVTPTAY